MNYYIADCHFGHENVITFDRRPFADLYQMEDVMIMNWNAAVKKPDTVYILGDFCWGKADEWLRIVKRLNGQKVLIKGNHDLSSYPSELKNQFAEITDYKEIVDNGRVNLGRKVIMSHYPMPFFKRSQNPKYFMLYGHVHNTVENDMMEMFISDVKQVAVTQGSKLVHTGQIYNVGCMMPYMNYTPRTLDEIIRSREGQLKRIAMMNGG